MMSSFLIPKVKNRPITIIPTNTNNTSNSANDTNQNPVVNTNSSVRQNNVNIQRNEMDKRYVTIY